MKSNKQRRAEILAHRAERAAKKERAAARHDPRMREPDLGTAPCNPALLAPYNSYGQPDFVARGYYIDMPFECRSCRAQEVWRATQQKWWYEVAKGNVESTAMLCNACRRAERERRGEARRVHLEGLARKKAAKIDAMAARIRVAPLAEHPEALPVIRDWFETQWPAYYGPGGRGDAAQDLLAFAGGKALPVGVVAFFDGQPCGIAALKAQSVDTHAHLGPWAAAGLVLPEFRGRGIGSRLVREVEDVARRLGHATLYCGTATANGLLQRGGWEFIEQVEYDGEAVSIYRKAL